MTNPISSEGEETQKSDVLSKPTEEVGEPNSGSFFLWFADTIICLICKKYASFCAPRMII
jgi:hypothetical protein